MPTTLTKPDGTLDQDETTTATPTTATPTTATQTAPRLSDRISDDTTIVLGIGWLLGYLLIGALEPTTSHPMPVIGIVLAVAFHVGLVATAAGLIAHRRWGLTASLGSSVLLLASVVACPTTGHHPYGAWWLGQMVVAFALVIGTVVALQRKAPAAAE